MIFSGWRHDVSQRQKVRASSSNRLVQAAILCIAFLASSFVQSASGLQLNVKPLFSGQGYNAYKQAKSTFKSLGKTSSSTAAPPAARTSDGATCCKSDTMAAKGATKQWDTSFWLSNISPRLTASGMIISVITIDRTVPQAVRTSNGVLPQVPRPTLNKMIMSQLAKQSLIKTTQFLLMRECKLTLQAKTGSDPMSTMIAYGLTGVPFQSVLYNLMISDTYTYFGKDAPSRGAVQLIRETVLPGIFWCFIRECCATGGGLFLGGMLSPKVQAFVNEQTGQKSEPGERPNFGVRFASGVSCGAVTALGTQWLHNTCLTAGRLAALGEKHEAPHYTMSSIRTTYKELGPGMAYINFPQRMIVIAVACGCLNLMDIFKYPHMRMV